jgi:hypothetical protein
MTFHKATTTKGILDADGEQIEVYSVGDNVQFNADSSDAGDTFTVAFIEWNDEDPNDFVLYYVAGTDICYAHRMDVEHANMTFPELMRKTLEVFPRAVLSESMDGSIIIEPGYFERVGTNVLGEYFPEG